MHMTIHLLKESDLQALYHFEMENRAFFQSIGLGRNNRYYELHTFKEIVKELIEDQNKDLMYTYLIKDASNRVIGRVNLSDIIRGNMNKAELGYRMGEAHQGKGYATKAVKLVLEKATEVHKLHRIEAGTAIENMGHRLF